MYFLCIRPQIKTCLSVTEFLDYYRNARSCVFRLRFMRVLVLYFYFSGHYQHLVQLSLRIQQKQQFLLRHQLLLPHLRH